MIESIPSGLVVPEHPEITLEPFDPTKGAEGFAAQVDELCVAVLDNANYLIDAGEEPMVRDSLPSGRRRLIRRLSRHSYPSADTTMGIRVDGELAGAIGTRLPFGGDTSTISGWVAEKHTGKGIATSALTVVTRAIQAHGYGVSTRVRSDSSGSIRVLEKAGFHQIGRNRKGMLTFAVTMPDTLYEEDWDA